MTLTEQVQQLTEERSARVPVSQEVLRLQEFYLSMLETGIVQKPSYTLPSLGASERGIRSIGVKTSNL